MSGPARLDKVRQRLTAAENEGKPPVKKVARAEEQNEAPMSEEERERAFTIMLGQHRAMVSSWRTGFYALPFSVAMLAGYVLYRHTQAPWQDEAAHFVPLKDHVSAGAIGFALSLIILVCVLTSVANLTGHAPLSYISLALSLLPAATLGSPFLAHPALLSKHFTTMLWVSPLGGPLVAGTQVLVEYLWARMEADMHAFWASYKKQKGKAA